MSRTANVLLHRPEPEKKRGEAAPPLAVMDVPFPGKAPYTQLVCWSGLQFTDGRIVVDALAKEHGYRVLYVETQKTRRDRTGPGGRTDAFFYIHTDDISKFAIARFNVFRFTDDRVIVSVSTGTTMSLSEDELLTKIRDMCQGTVRIVHSVVGIGLILEIEIPKVGHKRTRDTTLWVPSDQRTHIMAVLDRVCACAPDCGPDVRILPGVSSGHIRWWEDVLDNGGGFLYDPVFVIRMKSVAASV